MDLEKIAPIIEDILKKTLEEKRYPFGFSKFKGVGNKVATGKLKDSISVTTDTQGDTTVIQVLAEVYMQWVQSGRAPGKGGVPIKALEEWIKVRGLQGRNKKGQYIKRKSFAFAIQNSIKRFGIRPSNFLDVALDVIMDDPKIAQLIENESYDELINLIEGI